MIIVAEGKHSFGVSDEPGVLQGIALGPLMFLSHINDLPDAEKSTVRV